MLQIFLNGIIIGGLYALISVGFTLIYSSVRFYHLAYGVIAIFGAYLTYTLQQWLGVHFFAGMMLSGLIFGGGGILFWQIFYAPLRRKKCSDIAMIVSSFGLLIIVQNIIALIYGNSTKSVSITDHIVPGYRFGALSITFTQLIILIATIVIVLIFEFYCKKQNWVPASER